MQTNNNYNTNLQPYARELRQNMTKAECCLWKYVLRAGKMRGYKFRRQRPVLNYIADFMCFDLKLIIEVDGYTHQLDETYIKDQKKDKDLNDAGYSVLRFKDEEVLTGIWNVARCIEQYIEEYEKVHPPTPAGGGEVHPPAPAGGGEVHSPTPGSGGDANAHGQRRRMKYEK